jgi:hypothetical protein
MERELFLKVKEELSALGACRRGRNLFSDAVIVLVYFWSVINDRPVSWACFAPHWPARLRRRRLPSQSRMSRRLRTASVRCLIDQLEARVMREGRPAPAASAIDGKPLPVGSYSHDRHAAWGRGAGVWARGYKLHLLLSLCGTVMAWKLTPMNTPERAMAQRMIRQARCGGYILGDKQYDANHLYYEAAAHGGQLVAPRMRGPTRTLGSRRQAPGRLRSKDLLENTASAFGQSLHAMRDVVERKFGYLTSTAGLLTHLPAWVRTYRRVRAWVQAKLILADLRPAAAALQRAATHA